MNVRRGEINDVGGGFDRTWAKPWLELLGNSVCLLNEGWYLLKYCNEVALINILLYWNDALALLSISCFVKYIISFILLYFLLISKIFKTHDNLGILLGFLLGKIL